MPVLVREPTLGAGADQNARRALGLLARGHGLDGAGVDDGGGGHARADPHAGGVGVHGGRGHAALVAHAAGDVDGLAARDAQLNRARLDARIQARRRDGAAIDQAIGRVARSDGAQVHRLGGRTDEQGGRAAQRGDGGGRLAGVGDAVAVAVGIVAVLDAVAVVVLVAVLDAVAVVVALGCRRRNRRAPCPAGRRPRRSRRRGPPGRPAAGRRRPVRPGTGWWRCRRRRSSDARAAGWCSDSRWRRRRSGS